MRKIQLSIKLETFHERASNGKHDHITIYSDGQELPEVIGRAVEVIRAKECPDIPYKEFCQRIMDTDTEADFFGRLQFTDRTKDE